MSVVVEQSKMQVSLYLKAND